MTTQAQQTAPAEHSAPESRDVVMAAQRDASWYGCPDTRTVKKYHISVRGVPACGNMAILNEETEMLATEVPLELRCKRKECVSRWP